MPQPNEFADLTALVTGASSGIGAETAAALGRHGAHVLVHYNHAADQARAVVARIHQAGASAEVIQADLSTREGTHSLIDSLGGRRVDLLINNAGSLVRRTRVLDFTEELWDEVMMLNLTSAFFLAQSVLPGMVERGSGAIVSVSSVAARTGGGLGAIAYSTAKAAINTMTRGLAKEFAPQGVRCNAVSPGTVDTNYHRAFSTPQMLKSVAEATPLGRLGTAGEIADVILFLCSKEAAFIHGQTIEANGGFLMT